MEIKLYLAVVSRRIFESPKSTDLTGENRILCFALLHREVATDGSLGFLEVTSPVLIGRPMLACTRIASLSTKRWDIKNKIKVVILFISTTLIFICTLLSSRERCKGERDKFKTIGARLSNELVVNTIFPRRGPRKLQREDKRRYNRKVAVCHNDPRYFLAKF